MRIATFDLASGRIDALPGMDLGKNVSPQWSPDGRELAFVSDRDGVSNIFLFNRDDQQVYQLTDLFTGAQGITPLSPVLSWARGADRLAFVYYSRDQFDVYGIDNPRSLQHAAWAPPARIAGRDSAVVPVAGLVPPADTGRPQAAPHDSTAGAAPLESTGSLYVTSGGFRQADATPAMSDSAERPVTITALMDSTDIQLPDTAEFKVNRYKVTFRPDYIARPSIGYTRDNFGRGFYGGSAVQLSDMLGNEQLLFAAYINGRISEALVNATYVNMTHRLNWAATIGQEPYYFLEPSENIADTLNPGRDLFITNLRRIVVRSVGGQAIYPISRFKRLEFGLTAASISDRLQQITQQYDSATNIITADPVSTEHSLGSASYIQPSVAYTFDNSLFGYVGPFYGTRYRLQASQSIGGWRYFEGLVDYRRYDHIIGPFTFATRALYFGRIGRDASRFRVFLGNTDLLRGNTSGSYYRNECRIHRPEHLYWLQRTGPAGGHPTRRRECGAPLPVAQRLARLSPHRLSADRGCAVL